TSAVALAVGANPGSATLGGTTTVSAQGGVASFGNLTLSRAGAGYTLTASGTGLKTATSSAFNINAVDVAVQFVQQPASAPAGTTLTPAVTVEVVDDSGNVVPSSKARIT